MMEERLDPKRYSGIIELQKNTKMVKNLLKDSVWNFVVAGFYLKQIRDNQLYLAAGFETMSSYAKSEFGFKSDSVISRFCQMNDRYSIDGNSIEINPKYEEFSKSQLQEMLYLSDEQIEDVTADMTVRDIRDIRKPEPVQEEQVNGLLSQMMERPDNIPGQIGIEELEGGRYMPKDHMDPAYATLLIKEAIYIVFSETSINSNILPLLIFEINEGCILNMEDFGGDGTFLSESTECAVEIVSTYVSVNTKKGKFDVNWNDFSIYIKELYVDDFATSQKSAAIVQQKEENNVVLQQEEPDEVIEIDVDEDPSYRPAAKPLENIIECEIKKNQESIETMRDYWEEHQPDTLAKYEAIVAGLELYLFEIQNKQEKESESEQVQPELPDLKNNDQRAKWLDDYRDWGVWYVDDRIGVTYYKYDFEDGSRLICEEYESTINKSNYFSNYFHLINPDMSKKKISGFNKFSIHQEYSKYSNSNTELIEFLKYIQKYGKEGK